VKPGANPACFGLMTVHRPSAVPLRR
jgi:hypothetical protein